MEALLSRLLDDKLWLMGGGTLLLMVAGLEALGWKKCISAVIGRLRVTRLIRYVNNEDDCSRDATLSQIFIYPVKSLRSTSVEEAIVDDKGLTDDRRYMLIAPRPPPLLGSFGPGESTHQFMTQRQIPLLATIDAVLSKDGSLRFSSHVVPEKTLTIHPEERKKSGGKIYKSRIWDDATECLDMGDEAALFFSEIVGKDNDAPPIAKGIRLVSILNDDRFADQKYTPDVALSWTGSLPKVGLTDGFPVLIANEASLFELNRRLQEKGKEAIPMSRFRPNIVISGAKAFDEDNWRMIAIGGVVFHLVKGCPRCKQSCTDQKTGKVSEEPLETLAEFRSLGPIKENVYFAQNAIPHDAGCKIRVGAAVQILERGDPIWDS